MRFIIYGIMISILMLAVVWRVGAQDDLQPASVVFIPNSELFELSWDLNICPEELIGANPHRFRDELQTMTYYELRSGSPWTGNLDIPAGILFLPPHTPCYKQVDVKDPYENLVEVESEYNICFEEILTRQFPFIGDGIFYVRRDAPPCYNDENQRLQYYEIWGKRLTQPYYSELPYKVPPSDACLGDLMRSNPQAYSHMRGESYLSAYEGAYANKRQFVPDDVRRCRKVKIDEESLYDISQRENVCIETILDASGLNLYSWSRGANHVLVPLHAPACYDAEGDRISNQDKAVHVLDPNEALSDVAEQYHVCLQDLWDANPALAYWRFYWDEPQKLHTLFIPDTPCDQSPTTIKTLPHHSIYTVSVITNVCINRLIEANPQYPYLNDLKWSQEFGEVITLTIPDRPPCYDFPDSNSMYSGVTRLAYVCYAVPVTEGDDFTGHMPPVSPSSDLEDSHCVERKLGMTIIYENQPYTLFPLSAYVPLFIASQCFDIEESKFILFSDNEYPWGIYPDYKLYLVPQPHADCGLNTADSQLYYQAYVEMAYRAGTLIDGVYTTNHEDTLSSIGHKFGYLPQWIADANNLSDPGMIYYLQELKMPEFPSFYTLIPIGGAAGFTVLMSTGIYRMRRWRRNRYASKKKNNAA